MTLQRADMGVDAISADRESSVPANVAKRLRLGWGAWLGVVWLAGLTIAAASASWLPLRDPLAVHIVDRYLSPGAEFWLGTDQIGRDMFARVVFGARVSLTVALFASLIPAVLGTVLGMLAGYRRGRSEAAIMGVTDTILAFPGIILALLVTAYAGATIVNIVLVLGFLGIPIYTRIARATTLALAQREFVLAARVLGATHLRIMCRELLPNVLIPVAVVIVVGMARLIVIEGILSFLGLSIPPPTPTWGNMIAGGVGDLAFHPYISFIPAAAMFLTVFALNTVSDALRKATDLREIAL
jgi:peptide/nickel transport system permease protein